MTRFQQKKKNDATKTNSVAKKKKLNMTTSETVTFDYKKENVTKKRKNIKADAKATTNSDVEDEKPSRKKNLSDRIVAGGSEEAVRGEALTASFGAIVSPGSVRVHTLILGTHPSPTSHKKSQYYGHPQNAFWYIAGDCLGTFRRDAATTADGVTLSVIGRQLRGSPAAVVPYDEQVNQMTGHGFAMWDIVGLCRREGALDANIRDSEPNDIRGFCEAHKDVRRIVLANGTTGSKEFMKHFRSWWAENDDTGRGSAPAADQRTVLVPGSDPSSMKIFKKYSSRRELVGNGDKRHRLIEVLALTSVSPANASTTYSQKRDIWEKYCYKPGLQDHKELNIN
uniref:Uracil-DNA glycosylase-like domain-containing protein n=1 Tax=Corethron hystrix TaxID=216773 RepID=A0A7S1BHN6_9STRA|mmetsp:Transcript_26707/g.61454  ORF Transcript_26707/g.61454 Transcript_26707/m.61454 type:complete len:339 (+) Transcript_26707:208-1224(+)